MLYYIIDCWTHQVQAVASTERLMQEKLYALCAASGSSIWHVIPAYNRAELQEEIARISDDLRVFADHTKQAREARVLGRIA